MKNRMNLQKIVLGLAVVLAGSGFAAEDGHEGHAHNEEAEAQRVPVTQEQVARLDIKISRALKGAVQEEIRVPGEIRIHTDRLAHVVPQIPGVVAQVFVEMGQLVKKGQVLAEINSRVLAGAKAEYLAAVERSKLMQEIFEREERLHQKKVSPEQDFLVAKQAMAEARILERSARQNLLSFGVSPTELETESEERFSLYRIVAPLDGTIIEKDMVQGEVVSGSKNIFIIADLSRVWLDLAISQDAIALAQKGQSVVLHLPDGSESETEIDFVSPIIDSQTRLALARATLANPDGRFRPGTFVEAGIRIPAKEETVVVPKASVQLVNDHPCVFVWGQSDFELREVVTGTSNGRKIEILQGLEAGELVASENAFHLKAELLKSGEAGCSGHSH